MTVRAQLVLLLGCAALAAGAAATSAAPTKKPAVIHASAPLPPTKPMSAEMKREQVTPAKQLFGEKKLPSLGRAMAIGYYPRGCLQGGVALPVRPTVQPDANNGLRVLSQIMTDKLFAARRDRIRRVVGALDGPTLERLDRALLVVLGLAR